MTLVRHHNAVVADDYFDRGMTGDVIVEVRSTSKITYTYQGGAEVLFIGENLGIDQSGTLTGAVHSVVFIHEELTFGKFTEIDIAAEELSQELEDNGPRNGLIATLLDGRTIMFGSKSDDLMFGGNHYDSIRGNFGNDRIHAAGGGDIVRGNGGSDLISGGAGSDELWGGSGQDRLYGNTGNDHLYGEFVSGGQGRDRFEGYWGNTFSYTGGGGADLFFINSYRDQVIEDFSSEQGDIIHFRWVSPTQRLRFIDTQGFHNEGGEVRYEVTGKDTILQTDLDGDAEADFIVKLSGKFELTKDCFGLVYE